RNRGDIVIPELRGGLVVFTIQAMVHYGPFYSVKQRRIFHIKKFVVRFFTVFSANTDQFEESQMGLHPFHELNPGFFAIPLVGIESLDQGPLQVSRNILRFSRVHVDKISLPGTLNHFQTDEKPQAVGSQLKWIELGSLDSTPSQRTLKVCFSV